MTEELDVTIHTPQTSGSMPLGETIRTLFLAGIGALALTREETEHAMKRFKAQGLPDEEAIMAAFESNSHDLARVGGK